MSEHRAHDVRIYDVSDDGPVERPDATTMGLVVCMGLLIATVPISLLFQLFMSSIEHPTPAVGLMLLVVWSYIPAVVTGFILALMRPWPSLGRRYLALLLPPLIIVALMVLLFGLEDAALLR